MKLVITGNEETLRAIELLIAEATEEGEFDDSPFEVEYESDEIETYD